jgi:ribosomal protein S1
VVVSVGQEIEAVVLAVDSERRRIGLSMAASDGGNAEDVAQATRAHPTAKFGTFADLLKKR